MGHNIDRRISIHMVWSIILCLHGVKYHVIDVAGEGGESNEIFFAYDEYIQYGYCLQYKIMIRKRGEGI